MTPCLPPGHVAIHQSVVGRQGPGAWRKILCVIAVLFPAVTPAAADKPRITSREPQAIEITARPIAAFLTGAPQTTRFGALHWVGGFEMSSRFAGFGGFSALAFTDAAGRRLLAASDAGLWLEADLVTEGERPIAVRNARMTAMRDERGQSVAGTWRGDAESLVIRGDDVLVGFEGINEVRRYVLRDLPAARAYPFPMPAAVKELRRSRGLEALAAFPPGTRHAGALLAVAESPTRAEAWHRAWIVGGAAPGAFRILHKDDFHVTDTGILPNGDVLLLERRVRIPFGILVRMRRLPAAVIASGATADGPVVFEADMSHAIDNLEGMALHAGSDGATYITLISDDNYSVLQRTLLLRFRLAE
jgi:hypothetical protein